MHNSERVPSVAPEHAPEHRLLEDAISEINETEKHSESRERISGIVRKLRRAVGLCMLGLAIGTAPETPREREAVRSIVLNQPEQFAAGLESLPSYLPEAETVLSVLTEGTDRVISVNDGTWEFKIDRTRVEPRALRAFRAYNTLFSSGLRARIEKLSAHDREVIATTADRVDGGAVIQFDRDIPPAMIAVIEETGHEFDQLSEQFEEELQPILELTAEGFSMEYAEYAQHTIAERTDSLNRFIRIAGDLGVILRWHPKVPPPSAALTERN